MKTVLLLSLLLCAASAAPAEDKQKAPEAAAAEAPQEQMAATPAHVPGEESALESRFDFCPDGWFSHGSRCFLFVNTRMSWYNAEEHCKNQGAHLASVTNRREYNFLQQITQTIGQSTAWLGGFNLQGQWLWIDGESFHDKNWYSPSSGSYPCMYLRSTNGLGNTRCDYSHGFICSKDPFSC